jgi:hypothetical protein
MGESVRKNASSGKNQRKGQHFCLRRAVQYFFSALPFFPRLEFKAPLVLGGLDDGQLALDFPLAV